jgi:Synaptobrevin/Ankyrin repeats (3 copies)
MFGSPTKLRLLRKRRQISEIRDDSHGNLLVDDFTVEIDKESEHPEDSPVVCRPSKIETIDEGRIHVSNQQSQAELQNDLDDLDRALAGMNIDRDFNTWHSFRQSMSSIQSIEEDMINPPDWQVDLMSFQKRWRDRDEVYSHLYKPTQAELDELTGTRVLLGLSAKPSWSGLMRAISTSDAGEVFGPSLDEVSQGAVSTIFHPSKPPYSILLQRGPVMSDVHGEAELVLFTLGVMLARTIVPVTSSKNITGSPRVTKKPMLVRRRLVRAWLWSDLQCVSVSSARELTLHSSDADTVVLSWPHRQQQDLWRRAIEKVYTEYAMRALPADLKGQLGWQYQWMRRPAYYVAVSNKVADSKESPQEWSDRNEVDTYRGYTPLHYAVRLHHTAAVQYLIQQARVDPNIKDKEDHAPMYYAVRDEAPSDIIQFLEQHGANKLEAHEKDVYEQGMLFGQVAAVESKMTQQKQAQAAQSAMAENIRLINERGEKIEELGNKAQNLNESAQSYAEMARKLKEKTQKKWYMMG